MMKIADLKRLLAASILLAMAGFSAAEVIQTVNREFDALSRLKKITHPDGRWVEYEYDANGNRKLMRESLPNAASRETKYGYDALNRLVKITDAYGKETNLVYDGRDNLVQVSDPRGLITTYSYNGFDDLIKQVSPDTGSSRFDYTSVPGVMTETTDARGRLLSYKYDPLGRVIGRSEKNGSVVSQQIDYVWDTATKGAGRPSHVTLNRGNGAFIAKEIYAYDSYGRLASKKQQVTDSGVLDERSIVYHYDTSGRLAGLTSPSGANVAYSYDAQGRVSGIQVDGNPLIGNIGWQPFGGVKGWTWSNGLVHSRTYDSNGRLKSLQHGSVFHKTVNWDLGNRIDAITDSQPGLNQSYEYDLLDRLKKTSRNGVIDTYSYDADGNRTASSWGTVNHSYAYPATSNRLTSRTGPTAASSNSYSYDAAGNLINDGKFKYDYSDGGRLIAFKTLGDVVQYRYYYNAKGERVFKKGGVYDRRFVYDEDGRLLGEYDKATTFWQEYVWLGDTLVATIRLAPVAGQPKTIQYVFTDHLDTPRAMAKPNATTTLTWRWEGEAFGNSPANGDADGDGQQVYLNLRFPGQYWDGELGRHYNYFRDYDPALGRYVQSDPIGLRGGVNTYGYVSGNPLTYADPTGEAAICFAFPWGTAACAAAAVTTALTVKQCTDGVSDTTKGFENAQKSRDEKNKALACLNDAKCSGTTAQNHINASNKARNDALKNASDAALNLGGSVPGTSATGPVPTDVPGQAAGLIPALIAPVGAK